MAPSVLIAVTSASMDFSPTLGAVEIAAVVAIFLFGILTVQTHVYYRSFDDSTLFRVLIGVIWLFVLAYIVCITNVIYTLTVVYYAQPAKLAKMPAALHVSIFLGGTVDVLVQSIYTFRIYKFTRNKYLLVVCWTIAVFIFAAGISFTVEGFRSPTLDAFATKMRGALIAVFTSSAVMDVIITGSLSWYLYQKKSYAMPRLAKLLDSLILWTVQTGMLTCLVAISWTTCFITTPHTYAWIALFIPAPPLFLTCLLALLNGRLELNSRLSSTSAVVEFVEGPLRFRSHPAGTTAGMTDASSSQASTSDEFSAGQDSKKETAV